MLILPGSLLFMKSFMKSPPPPAPVFMALTLRPPRASAMTDRNPRDAVRSRSSHCPQPPSPSPCPNPGGSQTPSAPSPGIVATPMFATARPDLRATRRRRGPDDRPRRH